MNVRRLGLIPAITAFMLLVGWLWAASISFVDRTTGSNRLTLSVGDRIEVEVRLSAKDVKLTGISLFILYDPRFIEVEDADPKTAGIQPVEPTDLLSWMIFSNEVRDPEAPETPSIVDFSMATLMRDKSFSGEGTVGIIRLRALRPTQLTAIRLETDATRHLDSRYTFVDQDGAMKTAPFPGINRLTMTIEGSPPRLEDIPDVTFIIGERTYIDLNRYVVDYDDPELKGIKWSFSGPGNVVVNLTPDNKAYLSSNGGWTGQETITFTVTDADGYSTSDTCTVTILPDTFPRVLDIPDVIAKSDGSYMSVRIDLDDYVVDSDTPPDEIEWSYFGNANVVVNIDPITHEVTFSSSGGWVGRERITFRATDPDGNIATDDCAVEIVPNSLPPVLSEMPNVSFSLKVGFAELDLNKYLSDMDTPPEKIRWSFHGNSLISVEITPQNIARFSATRETSERITFTATDPDGNSAEKSITVTAYQPKPPVISDLPAQKLRQGEMKVAFDLDDFASDDQTPPQKLIWKAEGYNPAHLIVSIDDEHLLTLTASSEWFGAEEIKLTATDQDGNSASKTLKVKVAAPPTVKPIPPLSIAEGQTDVSLDLDDYVHDPDTPPGEISWRSSGYINLIVVVDSNNHRVMIHAPEGSVGSERIIFTATDPDGNSAEVQVTVTVYDPNVSSLPRISPLPDVILKQGESKEVRLVDYISDEDTSFDSLRFTVRGNTRVFVNLDESGLLTLTAPEDWTGEENLTVEAVDPEGNSASERMKVMVMAGNPGEEAQPLTFKVFVTPNPATPRILHVTVISSNRLTSPPTVEIGIGDGVEVRMERIAERIWSGMLTLPEGISGEVNLRVSGDTETTEVKLSLDDVMRVADRFSPGGGATLALSAYPNPITGDSIRLVVSVPRSAAYGFKVRVFTTSGRLVGSLDGEKFTTEGETYVTDWDLRSESGERLARGVYILVLEAGGMRISRKVVRR
jgi:hypothetical protein